MSKSFFELEIESFETKKKKLPNTSKRIALVKTLVNLRSVIELHNDVLIGNISKSGPNIR